jgi:hypothetical protein
MKYERTPVVTVHMKRCEVMIYCSKCPSDTENKDQVIYLMCLCLYLVDMSLISITSSRDQETIVQEH